MGKKDVAEASAPSAGASGSTKSKSKPKKEAKGLAGSGLSKQKNNVMTITLEDGTEMPVGIPPGMDAGIAQQVIEYLRKNPAAAKQTLEKAQKLIQNPAMAAQMVDAQRRVSMSTPEYKEKLMQLKDDPELKGMFEDIQANQGNMEKYWNDTELMSKISAKLEAMNIGPTAAVNSKVPSGHKMVTLQDAAKVGDLEALKSMLENGADVNAADDRGISPLGVAVGFNRVPLVKQLLAAGADVQQPDRKGNTVLHYAAGYGRKEAARLLLEAGADMTTKNLDGQQPVDVARLNKEMHMVTFLDEYVNSPEAKGESIGSKFL